MRLLTPRWTAAAAAVTLASVAATAVLLAMGYGVLLLFIVIPFWGLWWRRPAREGGR